MENSMPKRLERSRRHRGWINTRQSNISGGDDPSGVGLEGKSPINTIGSQPNGGIVQKSQVAIGRSRFSSSHGVKPNTPNASSSEELQSTPQSQLGIDSVPSQDSTQTSGSVASRRQRIIALSAKNKSNRRSYNNSNFNSSPKVCDTDVITESNTKINESRSWQSSQPKKNFRSIPPEPIETKYSTGDRVTNFSYRSPKASPLPFASSPCESSLYQSNEMLDGDSKEQSRSAAGQTDLTSKSEFSNKLKSFQRDSGMTSSSNDRSSPIPPPPPSPDTRNSNVQAKDSERVDKFKSWSEREQKERGHDNRVVAFPSPTGWRASTGSASSGHQHVRGSRIVIPRSPTTSVCSADSSFSSQQSKLHSSAPSGNTTQKHSWSNSTRVNSSSKSNGLPEIRRTFSSPKYGSPQSRYSSGNKKPSESPVFMYKQLLKPVQKETEVHSHEKEAYGAIIETPQKSSVSSLHAMFNSQKAVPLMPMNSTNSSVRHSQYMPSPSTPSPLKSGGRYRSFTGRNTVRHSSEGLSNSTEPMRSINDDPSVSPVRSLSSSNLPRHSVVSSWSQKQHAEKNVNQQQQYTSPSPLSPKHKNILQSKSFSTDDKSRVRQFYNSPSRMESPVEIMEKNNSKLSSDTREDYKNDVSQEADLDNLKPSNLITSWQQRCKPRRPMDSDLLGPPTPLDVKGTETKGKTRKNVEQSELLSSAVSSLMYSQNLKPKKTDPKRDVEVKTRENNEANSSPSASPSFKNSQDNRKFDEIDIKKREDAEKLEENIEPNTMPPSAIASSLYSQNSEENRKTLCAAVDWPGETNENIELSKTEFEETTSDVILDSITDVGLSDTESSARKPGYDKDTKNAPTTEEHISQEPHQDDNFQEVKRSEGIPMLAKSQLSKQMIEASIVAKPWEKDSKHSLVQSWQNFSSKTKEPALASSASQKSDNSSKDESNDSAEPGNVAPEADVCGNLIEEVKSDTGVQVELITTKSSSDSFIEEKKSDDLSFDEDEILGENIDRCPSSRFVINTESSQTGDQSNHPNRIPFYDDDSYLSRGDTDTRELVASESMKTTSGRSRNITTENSEEMSVYVEDERIISKIEDKFSLSPQYEQAKNLEVAAGAENEQVEEVKEGAPTAATALTINVNSCEKKNLPRLHPSPKDCAQYRSTFFEESGGASDIRRRKNGDGNLGTNNGGISVSVKNDVESVKTKKSIENHVFDVWISASHEERDEAIKFDETEQWLNRDPDIEASVVVDDASASSEIKNSDNILELSANLYTESKQQVLIKKPPQSYRTPEKQKQRAKVLNKSAKKVADKEQSKQDVFDPFGADADEVGLTVEISEDLFSSNPDPFMTQESFSPLEWSVPSGVNTNEDMSKNNPQSQHIGYYNSPDSRVEI